MSETQGQLRIGMAFGGGGAKGFAHIGVLKVFEKYGIKPNFIAGTSVGSIIGAAYALGYNSDEIMERAESFRKKFSALRNFNLFSDSIIKDKQINKAIMEILGEETTFDDLKIPFIATAVNLESGKEFIMDKGKLWEVARASSAIPFIFSPRFINEKYVVDGGLLNNIPVDHVRAQGGIDVIIGIDLGGMTSRQYISAMVWEKYYKKPKIFQLAPGWLTKVRLNMILMAHIFLRSIDIMREVSQGQRLKEANADIIIKPDVESIALLDFEKYKEGIDIGIEAAEAAMPKLLKILENKKADKHNEIRARNIENETES